MFMWPARIAWLFAPMGPAGLIAEIAMKSVKCIVGYQLFLRREEYEKVGYNYEQGEFFVRKHGSAEPFFPFRLITDVPGEKAVFGDRVSGRYIFRLPEWFELRRWLERHADGSQSFDQDEGLWLLQVGRIRWASRRWRRKAFDAVRENSDLPDKVAFMLRAKDES